MTKEQSGFVTRRHALATIASITLGGCSNVLGSDGKSDILDDDLPRLEVLTHIEDQRGGTLRMIVNEPVILSRLSAHTESELSDDEYSREEYDPIDVGEDECIVLYDRIRLKNYGSLKDADRTLPPIGSWSLIAVYDTYVERVEPLQIETVPVDVFIYKTGEGRFESAPAYGVSPSTDKVALGFRVDQDVRGGELIYQPPRMDQDWGREYRFQIFTEYE